MSGLARGDTAVLSCSGLLLPVEIAYCSALCTKWEIANERLGDVLPLWHNLLPRSVNH